VAESDGAVVDVGPIAHGGHCVARLDGRVVFVRHALPGERVRIAVTEKTARFWRADAVEVIEAAPERVTPPCRHAGRCGGCDFQHVSPPGQRALLTEVVREQLRRLAGFDWRGEVEAVDPDALGWRTRIRYSVDERGRAGLRAHRSHHIVDVRRCPLAHPDTPPVPRAGWEGDSVEAIVSSTGQRILVTDAPRIPDGLGLLDGVAGADGVRRSGSVELTERVRGRDFTVTGSGFWQVHPAAAGTLVDAVLDGAQATTGDVAFDLYGGVGLFAAFLAEQVGPSGRVVSVEGGRSAHGDAKTNLSRYPHARAVRAPVEKALIGSRLPDRADVVVLDPPRSGAKAAVRSICALEPRRIVYVACDPAALARDLGSFAARGYSVVDLRAFALFPMTHHVECVAVLAPASP